jgi:hypothetical protein
MHKHMMITTFAALRVTISMGQFVPNAFGGRVRALLNAR